LLLRLPLLVLVLLPAVKSFWQHQQLKNPYLLFLGIFPFLRDVAFFLVVLFLKLTNTQTKRTKTANSKPSGWAAGMRDALVLYTGHVLAMLLPRSGHDLAMLLPATFLPCSCQALAMHLPCSCHALAAFSPCSCRVLAMLLSCFRLARGMLLSRSCHAVAMFLPQYCHVFGHARRPMMSQLKSQFLKRREDVSRFWSLAGLRRPPPRSV